MPIRFCKLTLSLFLAAATLRADAPVAGKTKALGLDSRGIDRTVAPGSDFFRFANGAWMKATEIPADRGGYGVSTMVADRTSKQVAELIQEAAKASPAPGTPARKVADYYASYMDEAGIESKGVAPLQAELETISAIQDRATLSRVLGGTLRADVDAFNATNFYTDHVLGLWVAQDLDEPTHYTPFLLQGGLDMPDRAYYLEDSARMAEIRARYKEHVATMLALAGLSDAETHAARVYDLEHRIAEVHASREESEDVRKGNNRWPRGGFDKAPGMDWNEYFRAAGLEGQTVFVVWQPQALVGIASLVGSEPLESWRDYLVFHAVEHAPGVLPDAFGRASFAFHGTVMTGTPQRRDRWKRAIDATNAALGEAVGQMYVERHFPASEKARATAMVGNLIAAFARRIDNLTWMTAETKAKAKAKLAVLEVGLGYPDVWTDYSGLEVVPGDAYGNAQRAELFEYRRSLARLGQRVDRGEWVMTPQTVNAVNLPAMNAMNFPAAMLQPPYFDKDRPAAMDYGAIGAVIGHEISHSFDDQGALFDAEGRLANWWTAADKAHFDASALQLRKQYDAYRPFPDLGVNGKLTLSENIADVAGLSAALDAWRLSLNGRPAPVVGGLSGEQQFFLSYAQSYRQKVRDAALRQQLMGDSHAPNAYRTATVRNLDAWYSAFSVRPGQALYLAPADRVRMW